MNIKQQKEAPPALGVATGSAVEVQVIVKPAGPMIHGVVIRASDGLVLRQWTSSDDGCLKHDLFSGPLAAAFWRNAAPQGYTVISWNDQPNAADVVTAPRTPQYEGR